MDQFAKLELRRTIHEQFAKAVRDGQVGCRTVPRSLNALQVTPGREMR